MFWVSIVWCVVRGRGGRRSRVVFVWYKIRKKLNSTTGLDQPTTAWQLYGQNDRIWFPRQHLEKKDLKIKKIKMGIINVVTYSGSIRVVELASRNGTTGTLYWAALRPGRPWPRSQLHRWACKVWSRGKRRQSRNSS